MDKRSVNDAITVRPSATANLMIDSVDGTLGAVSCANFSIVQREALLNGFFSRIGVTEVVLEWNTPNVRATAPGVVGNNDVTVTFSGPGAPSPVSFTLGEGFYTVEQALNQIAEAVLLSGVAGFHVAAVDYGAAFSGTPVGVEYVMTGGLPTLLGIAGVASVAGILPVYKQSAQLRYFRYLDIVSPQLTYNQELKDASSRQPRDVIVRWYMAWDTPPDLDGFGFPILMGYTPFVARRIYSPPKLIRWSGMQPIGQVSFQVYPNFGNSTATLTPNTQFLLTLQASED